MSEQQLLQDQAILVMETIEDAVESICNENLLSGEKVWTMVYALADTKLNQFPEIEEEDDEN